MLHLKNETNEPVYKRETDLQTYKTGLLVAKQVVGWWGDGLRVWGWQSHRMNEHGLTV